MNDHNKDRDLLLGIVACQMDLITPDGLAEVIQDWSDDEEKTLGELLRRRGNLAEHVYESLARVVDSRVSNRDGQAQQGLVQWSMPSILGRLGQIQASLTSLLPDAEAEALEHVGTPTDAQSSRYRILRSHARGGLGEVFIAEDTQFQRRVALKRIRSQQANSPIRTERFLLEAKITGRLEHPGIVPVYGMGTHADGRPFYAMRLIRGETLRVAVQRFHGGPAPDYVGLEFRLLLSRLVDVCNTIGYAHSQRVLHRDLKPTNIMLGDFGETLVVDWGVAKHLGRSETAEAVTQNEEQQTARPDSRGGLLTVEGQAIGTPAYMSPEQAAGIARGIGPLSDVYSLGATLYVMLTDRPPFEGEEEDVFRKVRQGDFPTPRQVKPSLPAALDAICCKAMALKPGRRYQSALDLARDIERWLAEEPVSAYREPWIHRRRRWVRRRQTLVSGLGAALIVGFVALGMAVPLLSYAWRNEAAARQKEQRQRILAGQMAKQAEEQRALAVKNLEAADRQRSIAVASEKRAAEERDRAEKALRFLVEAFRKPDPAADGRTLKVVDLLDRAAKEIETTFADSSPMRATLLQAIGETFSGLGLPQESLAAFRRVAALRRETLGEDHPETLAATRHLAVALQDVGRLDQAIPLYESVLAKRKAILGEGHPETLESMNDTAVACCKAGQFAKAIPLYQDVLKQERARLGDDDPETLTVMDNLAVAYSAFGEVDKAIPLQESALSGLRTKLGDENPATLITMNNLAKSYVRGRRLDEAIRLYEATLGKIRSKLGSEHPNTLTLLNGLAKAYQAAGRRGDAIRVYEEVLAKRSARLGSEHPDALRAAISLAKVYFEVDRPEKAVPLAEESLRRAARIEDRLPGPVRKEILEMTRLLVNHFTRTGRNDKANGYRKLLERHEPRD
jgi:tetratricopeptide (TPR) repeat protein/tRNA A-37 threonylcarbamoyl transferase component Bud32